MRVLQPKKKPPFERCTVPVTVVPIRARSDRLEARRGRVDALADCSDRRVCGRVGVRSWVTESPAESRPTSSSVSGTLQIKLNELGLCVGRHSGIF
jgi:hypothetical protein